jgi:hypothetical protein
MSDRIRLVDKPIRIRFAEIFNSGQLRLKNQVPIIRLTAALFLYQPHPINGDDLELRDLNTSDWPCLNQPSGTAKTPDGIERNLMKNRGTAKMQPNIQSLDTAGFLKKVSVYDEELKAHRRNELTGEQKKALEGYENQIVSLTGYLVLAYSGPPETCNCGDKNFHDWHLEIFEKPSDHHPQPGDPTPIICETTPRTEQKIFRDGIRLQTLTGFFRSQKQYPSTNHPSSLIKVTGFLMWDDDHNGTADVGTAVSYITPGNGFHHPWRSTAWELHPILKIEPAKAVAIAATPSVPPSLPTPSATTTTPAGTPSAPQFVTLTQPVEIQILYGKTIIPKGIRLPVVSYDSSMVRVRYMNETYSIPISSTDLP